MKLTAPILLLFTLPMLGQNDTATGPKTAHEYAMSQIKAFNAYRKSEGYDFGNAFYQKFCGVDKCQIIYVDLEGKIELDGITIEDAFLLLMGSELEKQLADIKRWDAEDKLRAKAPPSVVKIGKRKIHVEHVDSWNPRIGGETSCKLNHIWISKDGWDKQIITLHEVMHIATDCDDRVRTHQVIYRMAPQLLKMIQDNPDLVKYLTEKPQDATPSPPPADAGSTRK